jgi:cytochrome c
MRLASETRGWVFAAFLVALADTSAAAGDATRGARLFAQCAACHSIKPGEHLTGPSLAIVLGRKAGSDRTFLRYSDALKASQVTWDEASLDRWLADPQGFIPGNDMAFAGIKAAAPRQDLVAYLDAVSRGEAPKAAAPRRGMMGSPRRANLKKADADSQVVSLAHCRDTYTVKTASGETHRIWEFNLRLKSDSSEYGPAPGAPVITASGMRGDRASIIFATPSEITPFIKDGCP